MKIASYWFKSSSQSNLYDRSINSPLLLAAFPAFAAASSALLTILAATCFPSLAVTSSMAPFAPLRVHPATIMHPHSQFANQIRMVLLHLKVVGGKAFAWGRLFTRYFLQMG